MIIVQYSYRGDVVMTIPVDMEFNRKNCEYIEYMVNKNLIEKPAKYDKFELYETS